MRSYRRTAGVGILLACAALFATVFASAGTAASVRAAGHAPGAGPSGVIVVSPARHVDLRHMTNLPTTPLPKHFFLNRPTMPLAQYNALKTAKASPGTKPAVAKAPAGPLAISSLGGFNGITQATAESTWPSDSNGAVGGIRVAEVVNQHLTVFNKATQAQTSDRSFTTITGYTAQGLFDPRIVYDPVWQRWVGQVEAAPESSTVQYEFLLVSTSNFPGGGYFVYKFNVAGICGNSTQAPFWDYPQIGMNQDGIVMTANCFQGNAYAGPKAIIFGKATVYNGYGTSLPVYSLPAGDGTVTPSQVYDDNPNMDLITRNQHLITLTNPGSSFYSRFSRDATITGFTAPSVPRSAGQAGCTTTSCQLSTGDGRFTNNSTEYGGTLWNVADYGLSGNGTFATPTWGQFDTASAATTQHGSTFLTGCSDDFNPALVAQNDGRMWLNFTSTNPEGSTCGGTFVRQVQNGRLSSTAANALTGNVITYTSPAELTGNFDVNFGTQRWGDTASMSRDPSDPTVAWSVNNSVADSNNWGTRIEKVGNN